MLDIFHMHFIKCVASHTVFLVIIIIWIIYLLKSINTYISLIDAHLEIMFMKYYDVYKISVLIIYSQRVKFTN